MKAKRLDNWEIHDLTGSCYFRDEEWKLFIAVSYILDWVTSSNYFPVNEDTGEIIHPWFELI
jgi:hypothetical protein